MSEKLRKVLILASERISMKKEKKIAYVTGGMGGIGTAICRKLYSLDYVVIAGCGPNRDFTSWLTSTERRWV